jgi:hypothetical protein
MRIHNNDDDVPEEAPKPATDPKRKPYQSPRFVVYGDLARLTMATKGGSRNDGGGLPKSKA